MAFVRYYVGDVVKMKKSHPCGSAEWEVKRIGTDFTIVCRGCGHQVMLSRPKFEKAVKKIVIRSAETEAAEAAKKEAASQAKVAAQADVNISAPANTAGGDTVD